MLEHVVEQLATLTTRLIDRLEPLISDSRRLHLLRLDPWRNSNRTAEEQAEFKTGLLKYYERCAPAEADNKPMAVCMVSNQVFPQPVVIASHIWKHCTGGSGLAEFGLSVADLDSPRNGLLLAAEIETAFDNKRVAFSFNLLTDEFMFHVLDCSLLEKPIVNFHDKKTATSLSGYARPTTIPLFKDLDNTLMRWLPSASPFRRLLAWHYAVATTTAAQRTSWHKPGTPPRPAPVGSTPGWSESESPDATWPSRDALVLFDHAVSKSERDIAEQQEHDDAAAAAAAAGDGEAAQST